MEILSTPVTEESTDIEGILSYSLSRLDMVHEIDRNLGNLEGLEPENTNELIEARNQAREEAIKYIEELERAVNELKRELQWL